MLLRLGRPHGEVELALRDACDRQEVTLERSTAAVVGATGQTGRALALMLAEQSGRVVLVGRAGRTASRIREVAAAVVDHLCHAFDVALKAADFDSGYTAVYPIKVNQQRTVVEQICAHGGERVGLEAGSKPELMAVLGVSTWMVAR